MDLFQFRFKRVSIRVLSVSVDVRPTVRRVFVQPGLAQEVSPTAENARHYETTKRSIDQAANATLPPFLRVSSQPTNHEMSFHAAFQNSD